MEYVASLSCGKDSLAMVLRLLEERKPLTRCVMYDTGAEFGAIYGNLEKLKPMLEKSNVRLDILKPKDDFFLDMLCRPVNGGEHYGYEWCGGRTRWGTSCKTSVINRYLRSLGEYRQYVGIAFDEPERVRYENGKIYPLVEWKMTERDCLRYCYARGFDWNEDGVELYEVLDRVSCWCCSNKNLKELKNMYLHLPKYWGLLKGLQSRIGRPFRRNGETVFDLEKRFEAEKGNSLF